jgi:predicted dehydrogenase
MGHEKIRIGVVGAGWFASRRHLPDIQRSPDLELVALCRRDEALLRKMADHFGVGQTFTDYERMLEETDLEAVLVCTPHALHYDHARLALERDLHVLVEKPLTVRADQAQALVELARSRQRVLLVALNPPYWKHVHYLRSLIQGGTLGSLEGAHLQWTGNVEGVFGRKALPETLPGVVPPTLFRSDPAINGGGYLIDGGSHQVSELLWATGQEVTQVGAIMDAVPSDMRAVVTLQLDQGSLATISGIADSQFPAKRTHHTYFGSEGTAIINGPPFTVTWIPHQGSPSTVSEEDLPEVPTPAQNLADVILGRSEPQAPPEHAARCVAIIEAAYRSARTGQTVPLAPPTGGPPEISG